MSSSGWETLAPHDRMRQLQSADGQYSVSAKVRTGGRQAGFLYLDLHDLDKGWTIIVLDDNRSEIARGHGRLKDDAWTECKQRLDDAGH